MKHKNKHPKVVTNPTPTNRKMNYDCMVVKNPTPANRSMNKYPKVKGK